MLVKILSILAAAALAVKAWAKAALWKTEKERRDDDRLAAAEAEVARLKIALGDALADGRVDDEAALRRQLENATATLANLTD